MLAKLLSFLGGTFFEGLAKVFLGWLKDKRAEETLKDLGAIEAKVDGLERAEHEERIAKDAGDAAARLPVDELRADDGFRRD